MLSDTVEGRAYTRTIMDFDSDGIKDNAVFGFLDANIIKQIVVEKGNAMSF